MKYCPKCQSRYTDDTLAFCLSDGERLTDTLPEDTPTLERGTAPTEIIASQGNTRARETPHISAPTIAAPPPVMSMPPHGYESGTTAVREKSNLGKYLLVALVALILGGAGAGIVFFAVGNSSDDEKLRASDNNERSRAKNNFNVGVPTPQPTPAPTIADPTPTATTNPSPSPYPANNTGNKTPVCYLTNSGNRAVNLRADCDTQSCDQDESTIITDLPAGTPVRRASARPVRGKLFMWVQITIVETGEIGWVAADKITCNQTDKN